MRLVRRVVPALVVIGWILLVPGVAQAGPAVPARATAEVQGVSVAPYIFCLYGGVEVSNTTGTTIEVRVYLDGTPVYDGNPWTAVPSGGSSVRISGAAPANGAIYSVVMKDGANEVPVGSVTYTKPDYCDDVTFAYNDQCSTVTITATNTTNANLEVNFLKLSGSTFTILASNAALPAGQSKTFVITVTNQPDVWVDIAPIVIPPNDRIEVFKLKGLDGDCPPAPTTPAPTATSGPTATSPAAGTSTTPAGDGLAVTGTGAPMRLLGLGAAFIVLGAVGVLVARRIRAQG